MPTSKTHRLAAAWRSATEAHLRGEVGGAAYTQELAAIRSRAEGDGIWPEVKTAISRRELATRQAKRAQDRSHK